MKSTANSHVRRRSRSIGRRRGFTLTELLVIVGIIVALAGIGLPMALRAYRSGNKMRTQSDLNAIATALNAYKQDFGDYPRVLIDPAGPANNGKNTGAAVLGKALVGTYGDGVIEGAIDPNDPPALNSPNMLKSGHCISNDNGRVALVDEPSSDINDVESWARFDANDGADGPGFRTRRGLNNTPSNRGDDVFQGKVYGPYLQAEKFNVVGTMIHDRDGAPILYFVAAPGQPNIREPVSTPAGTKGGFVDQSKLSKYDANDNLVYFKRPNDGTNEIAAVRAIRAMLGDFQNYNESSAPPATNCNGIIDPGETPATEEKFILWSAGPDGLFGPVRQAASPGWNPTKRDLDKCDDVTSFSK